MATASKSQYKGSDDGDIDCDVCRFDGIISPAISYCKLCTEALCLACEKVHKAARKTRGHALLTGDQLFSVPCGDQNTPSAMNCEKHQMVIRYFCEDDNIAICSTCKMMGHDTCETVEIRTYLAQNDHTKTFGMIQDRLVAIEKSYERLQKKRENDKNVLKVKIRSCLAETKLVRKEVDKIFDELEKKMAAEINKAQDDLSKQIDDHLTTADGTLRQIREDIATMTECQTSGRSDVMFVGMKKTQGNIPEYEKLMSTLDKELVEIDIQFKPDDVSISQLKNLKSFGRLDRELRSQQEIGFSALDLKLTDVRHYDVGSQLVSSVVCLQDHAVLACVDGGLKLIDTDFSVISQLKMIATGACKTSDTELLVSRGSDRELQFVEVSTQLVAKDVLRIGLNFGKADYYKGKIYVVCQDDNSDMEVRVLNRNGDMMRRFGNLGKIEDATMFVCDVKVNCRGDKLFVSNVDTHMVTCLDQQGGVIYKYSNTDMIAPTGMYVDGHDNLLLCGFRSHNVHVITPDGRKHGCLVTENDGIQNLLCITYRRHDERLIIGSYNHPLVSFNTGLV